MPYEHNPLDDLARSVEKLHETVKRGNADVVSGLEAILHELRALHVLLDANSRLGTSQPSSPVESLDRQQDISEKDEKLIEECLEIIRQEKKASAAILQRRLKLGYTQAARIVDILEDRGILGPENGVRGREILVDLDASM